MSADFPSGNTYERLERIELLLTELVSDLRSRQLIKLNADFADRMQHSLMSMEEREEAIRRHEERLLRFGEGRVPLYHSVYLEPPDS